MDCYKGYNANFNETITIKGSRVQDGDTATGIGFNLSDEQIQEYMTRTKEEGFIWTRF